MSTKTFSQLQEIDRTVAELYGADPELKQSKFGYWYTKWYKKFLQPVWDERSEAIQGMYVDHALEDPTTKAILEDRTSTRGYKFSKEAMKQVIAEEKKLIAEFDAKEVEIEPMIKAEHVPELTEEQKEVLIGSLVVGEEPK